MICFDLETSGLSPHNDTIHLAQFYTPGDDHAELIPNPSKAYLQERLAAADHIVGHNLHFDFGFAGYIPTDIEQFDDTFFLSRVQNYTQERHSLDVAATFAMGYNPYEGIDKKVMQKADWSQLTPDQIAYAELDVTVLPPLYNSLKASRTNPVYRFDKRSVIACLKMQRHGLPVDHKTTRTRLRIARTQLKSALSRLDFNPNSAPQTKKALGIESTGDSILAEEISAGNETAAIVREARKLRKHVGFLEKLDLHPRFMGTIKPNARSGRTTSDQENLQNLPRATKRLIAVPDNRVLLAPDYAQLELRTIACITEDETMLRLFNEGVDLHDYSARQMYGEDFTPTQRQIAKTFNFSLLYGAGAATVRAMLLAQTGINLEEAEVAELKKTWLKTFAGIKIWQGQGGTRHNNGTDWHTPHGRYYKSKRYTDHLSIENQGAGAEVARLALHKMTEWLPPEAMLCNFVHDSYLVECDNDPTIYKPIAAIMHKAMKYSWEAAPFDKHGVEMPVDVGVAHNWADADALKNCLYIYGDADEKS